MSLNIFQKLLEYTLNTQKKLTKSIKLHQNEY